MRCILFDLDGVLIDPRSMVFPAAKDVAIDFEQPEPEPDRCSAAALLSPKKAAQLLFPDSTQQQRYYLSRIRKYAQQLKACDGVTELLITLRHERLGIVTSRNQDDASLYLRSASIEEYFSVVISWGHTRRHKPYADPLLAALQHLESDSGFYVGDAPNDMLAAVSARMEPIAATWASQWKDEELLQAGATKLANHPADIIRYVRKEQ